jgi:hypothetical protein
MNPQETAFQMKATLEFPEDPVKGQVIYTIPKMNPLTTYGDAPLSGLPFMLETAMS